MKIKWLHTAILGASFAVAGVMQGCNGGGSDGGTVNTSSANGVGSGGSGYATGTVTGFGSVYVDGERIDDRSASSFVENTGGSLADADLKLGQRVEVETAQQGVAKAIQIMPAIIGLVQSTDTAALKLVVAGQTVLVNTDADQGPVTVFEGYDTLADVQIGDAVEVHGVPASSGNQIQASRIEKKPQPLSFVRVSSALSNLNTASKTFNLGSLIIDYATATLVPASRELANGQRVVVFGPSVSGDRLSARFIRIAELKNKGVAAQLGGVVSSYDSANLTFTVNGVKVNGKDAVITPAGQSFSNGSYVLLKGSYADNGELVASKIDIRRKAVIVHEVTLKGSVADFSSLASFKVRGVKVDASSATRTGCPDPLANGQYVEVEGSVGRGGITASKLTCTEAPEAASIEVRGVASSVDATARKLVLTSGGKTFDVSWSDSTRFLGITAANLAGAPLKVEGYLQGGVIVARRITR